MNKKIVLGTVQFGLDYGINNKKGKIPQDDIRNILNYSYRNGINALDTAYAYGDSEKIIGKYLQNKNNEFNIITKINKKNEIKESYNRLNRKFINSILIHNFNSFEDNQNIFKELESLKENGMTEKIGFSIYYIDELKFLLQNNINFDIIQIPYSIFDQRFDKYFKLLNNKKVEIHARSVFLQGLYFMDLDEVSKKFHKAKNKLKRIWKISSESNMGISELCLNFVNNNSYIDKLVIGIDSVEQLKENLKGLQKGISNDIYSILKSLNVNDENIILPLNW